ncbi:hypothetical protein NDU88_005453 [Pleurodeles waltl]|uniref:Uncharacterized protein n=1 Tax=Pleurodeles waltl TaxID=8319 RepID=A0AAV7UK25_PLEWA|nr:hypothetical protein NDU88_005453 [Pleurodeles waltl]
MRRQACQGGSSLFTVTEGRQRSPSQPRCQLELPARRKDGDSPGNGEFTLPPSWHLDSRLSKGVELRLIVSANTTRRAPRLSLRPPCRPSSTAQRGGSINECPKGFFRDPTCEGQDQQQDTTRGA